MCRLFAIPLFFFAIACGGGDPIGAVSDSDPQYPHNSEAYARHAHGYDLALSFGAGTWELAVKSLGTVRGTWVVNDWGYRVLTDDGRDTGCALPGTYDVVFVGEGAHLNLHWEDFACPRGPFLVGPWQRAAVSKAGSADRSTLARPLSWGEITWSRSK